MLRMLLSIPLMLAACTPSPQKAAMPDPSAVPANTVKSSGQSSGKPSPEQAASNPLADSPEEASGRRVLSTAFVRVGPNGHLTVELRDGRVIVLRDVVMRPKDYCGVQVAGDPTRTKYCGGYAEVAAARPGGVAADQPDSAASNVIEPVRGPAKAK